MKYGLGSEISIEITKVPNERCAGGTRRKLTHAVGGAVKEIFSDSKVDCDILESKPFYSYRS